MTLRLARDNLAALGTRARIPAYDVADLRAGIVHFGVGNFHRAHQAVYLDDLFESGVDRHWALIGAGVRADDDAMRRDLLSQDLLTTVVEQDVRRSDARITGSMIDFLPAGDADAILSRLDDPAIRIVSLTITEGGYFMDPATQRFDAAHPDIRADAIALAEIVNAPRGARPRTVFGLIVAALVRRRAAGIAPFAVLSCDNVQGNGEVTEHAVAGVASLVSPELAQWVRERVAFPNSMVDRITPATTDRERALLAKTHGIVDARPIFCEAFRQWVVEDRFPAGRPALENVGAQFVTHVEPFERMKIRILNGGHAAIAYPAGLLGIHFVHEAMQQPLIAAFLSKLLEDEIIPCVPPVPSTDLQHYKAQVVERFGNPAIGDTIRRLCLDGSNRQPKFILPSVADRLAGGRSIDGLALVGALWCRYCYGETESGATIEPNDPSWSRLNAVAIEARRDPRAWLGMTDIYGDVGSNPVYAAAFCRALERVWQQGSRAVLTRYVESRV
ncbi:MAG TPA: mannitol dehydrogenase family protein [Casimicrobiaceae bacterium]|nr:mannitol dehydrogenase family protein [Casimicrobiaceae bacterium]